MQLWRSLIAVDMLLASVALLIPFVLPALGAMQTTKPALAWVEVAVSGIVTVTGILGGASFALAGGLQLLMTRKVGTAAGSIVWADHTGACAGALLTGMLLAFTLPPTVPLWIPVVGSVFGIVIG